MVMKRRLRSLGGVGRRSPKPSGRRGSTRVPSQAGGGIAVDARGVGVMTTIGPSEGRAAGGVATGATGAGAVDDGVPGLATGDGDRFATG